MGFRVKGFLDLGFRVLRGFAGLGMPDRANLLEFFGGSL